MINITVANATWNYDVYVVVDDNSFDCYYHRMKHQFDYPMKKVKIFIWIFNANEH